MKKLFFFYIACIALFVSGCKKEVPNQEEEPIDNQVSIDAVMDGELQTKSDYAFSGKTAVFEWTAGDKFYRLTRANSYGNYAHKTYTISDASINGATASFTGDAVPNDHEDTGFALYPTNAISGSEFGYSNSPRVSVYLSETAVTYDAANPLKNIIPMVGKLVDGAYQFKPITGVIAVPIIGIPSDATSVSISTTAGGFTGKTSIITSNNTSEYKTYLNDHLGPNSEGLKLTWLSDASKGKTYNISSLSPSTTYIFYFPAPVGTYPDLTIKIKNGNTELHSITASGLSLSIRRAEIVPLNTLNLNYVGTAISPSITTDNPNQIKAYYSVSKGTVTKVVAKAITAKTQAALDEAIPDNTSGTEVTAGTSSGAAVEVVSGFGGSGQYYIGIKAFNEESEVASHILGPIYYLSNADKNKLLGEITTSKKHTMTYTPPSTGSMTYGDLTLSLSSDCTKGQIILTDFDGLTSTSSISRLANDHHFFKCNVSKTSVYYLGGVTGAQHVFQNNATNVFDGNTYYGVLKDNRLVFKANADNPLFWYSVDGNAEHTAKVVLFSNAGSTSDSPQNLSFNYDGATLSVDEKYIVVRWYGYYYNGSVVTNSGGYASGTYASDVSITLL